MRRISVNQDGPSLAYDWDDMGEVKVYLKHAPNAKIYFETIDQDKREGVIFVFDKDGHMVIVGDESLKATITDVDIVIEMSDERRAAIEDYFVEDQDEQKPEPK